jgi:hypothetical protein
MKKTVLCALATLLALPAAGADGGSREGPYVLDLHAAAYGGAFDGYEVREESGPLAVVAVRAQPEVRGRAWFLEVPFRVSHRETFGVGLSETGGSFDLEPWLQLSRSLRVGLDAGVAGRSRPGWADLYNDLQPTDRYSYLAWRAGVQAYARPGRHQHLRLRYRFVSYDYVDDPDFDPNAGSATYDPMHLTPGDQDDHLVDLSWRYHRRAWAFAVRIDFRRRSEQVLLARKARTGSTAAVPGGPPYTTPLQETDLWEPSVELDLTPVDSIDLSLRYGYDVQDDLYEGYYSFAQHHPRVIARWAMTPRLAAVGRYEGWFRTYGSDGTDNLDSGTRRVSSRFLLGAEVEYALGKGLLGRASFEYVDRGTNYTDYAPPGAAIDWDYTNVTTFAGLEYRL